MINQQSLLPLPGGQVDMWVAISEHVSLFADETVYADMLGDAERQQYEALRYPEHRFDYLLSRCLLRTVLSRYTGAEPSSLQFVRNQFGKPELDAECLVSGAPLPLFNLSLTDGVAVCAVSHSPSLGVDVEYHGHGRSMLDVADQYFSALEIAELKRLPKLEQQRGFFRYWTLKESLVKAKGEGQTVPLDSFSFRLGDKLSGSARLVSEPEGFLDDRQNWGFRYFDLGQDYTAAVSVAAPIENLCLRESVPLFGDVVVDSPDALFSHAHQDALSATFC